MAIRLFGAMVASAFVLWSGGVWGATLKLKTGQTLEVADFSRRDDSVRIETSGGAVLSLPVDRFVSPVEGWLKDATEAEKAERYEEAAALVKLVGKWDESQRDEEREATLLAKVSQRTRSEFLTALKKGDYEGAAKVRETLLAEGELPEACAAALKALLDQAEAEEKKGDFDAAEKAYRNYLVVAPDAPGPAAAIEGLGDKRRRAVYEKSVADALEEARTGSVSAARAALKELLQKHPGDKRLTDALDGLDHAAREAEIRRQIDATRRFFENGDFEAFTAACAVIEKAGGDTSELAPLKKQIEKVRVDFAKTWHANLKKNPRHPVPCAAMPDEPYYLYLPPEYDGTKPFPILYVHAPGGRNDHGVRRLMEKIVKPRKWIVVQPLNSQNGPWGAIWKAQDCTLKDTTRHLNLDPRLRFAAGMSGGGRASLSLAFRHPGKVRGVMPMGAGWPINTKLVPRSPMAVCIVCGRSDSNMKHDIPDTFQKLKRYGLRVKTMLFQGGHTLPPKELAEQGFEWLLENAP